jgi:hypothetical protein
MNVISDFFVFTFRSSKETIKTRGNKIIDLIILLLFDLGLVITFTFFVTDFLVYSGMLLRPQNRIPIADQSDYTLILTAVILSPLMEEILFRSWLIYNRIGIAASTMILFVYGIYPSISHQKLFVDMRNTSISLFIGFIIFLVTFFALKNTEVKFVKQWNKHTKKIFFISALLFGYSHIFNYKITPNLLLFSSIILLPFIVTGLILGYIRLKMGFLWGLFYHVASNLIIVLIIIALR